MTWIDRIFGERCRMCGRRGTSRLGAVAPTHIEQFHTSTFDLIYCRRCDVVYLDPVPTPADLVLLYERSDQFTDDHYTNPARVSEILGYYAEALRNLNLLPDPGGHVLEIGAGLAWVARVCKQIDPSIRTTAQDISPECANDCPWVDHYLIGSLDYLLDEGSFDLISLTHVIEHLADPNAMLQKIATLLAPDGKVFVTAPFRPSGWTREQGLGPWQDYAYLHVPAHITYFSRHWFARHAPTFGLRIEHWDSSHEEGQAFELVLRRN